tara:strand:- start:1615 stop:1911 length:297 start_codon:yes stop_codon:yes gene_type:complete
MILVTWIVYLILSILISLALRNIVKNFYFKKLIFAFTFSLLISSWFLYPGSSDLAPIISIAIFDLLELEGLNISRLLRPFIALSLMILFVDFLIKKRN